MPRGAKAKYLYARPESPFWQYKFSIAGQRYRGSTNCTEAKDASKFVEEERVRIRRELENSRKGVGQIRAGRRQVTLRECLDIFETDKGKSWKLLRDKKRYAEYLLGLGTGADMLLSDLSLAMLRRYRLQRTSMEYRPGQFTSDATVNREVAHLQAAINHLREYDFELPNLAWGKAKERDAETSRVRCLSDQEEERLLRSLSKGKSDLIPLVLFAIMSGQRKSAIVGLRWERVDLDAKVGSVELKGKGRRSRLHSFPLTDEMVALIQAQPRVADCPFVFTYECEKDTRDRHGNWKRKGCRYQFTEAGWTKAWLRALKEAGIDDFRFHDLRHTSATRLIRATGNIQLVQHLLGHSQIQTTARYANQDMDDVRRAMEIAQKRSHIRAVA